MCMLFEICEKRPFQKCMDWGGGGRWSQFCTKSCKRKDTQGTGNALRITHYSESDSLSSLRLFTRAGTFWRPACFTFCSKSTSMQVARNSCCEALVGCVFLSQNCAAKAAASEADRIWCSSWSHAGCCEPPVRCFFAVLGVLMRLTCTQVAAPERALLRVKDCCGASGDATARGVNLYPDMVAVC